LMLPGGRRREEYPKEKGEGIREAVGVAQSYPLKKKLIYKEANLKKGSSRGSKTAEKRKRTNVKVKSSLPNEKDFPLRGKAERFPHLGEQGGMSLRPGVGKIKSICKVGRVTFRKKKRRRDPRRPERRKEGAREAFFTRGDTGNPEENE